MKVHGTLEARFLPFGAVMIQTGPRLGCGPSQARRWRGDRALPVVFSTRHLVAFGPER